MTSQAPTMASVLASPMNAALQVAPSTLSFSATAAASAGGAAATTCRDVVPLDVEIPDGAVVVRAKLVVHAAPPGWSTISSVGEVRDDADGHVVIDFRRMRTVKALRIAGANVSEVRGWTGAGFTLRATKPTTVGDHFEFPEMQTERLRIAVDVAAAQVAAGAANLPTAPADLELLVANKRVWFQAGEVKRGAQNATLEAADFFVAGVDATEAIAAAAATATPVQVELRSSTPGTLDLSCELAFQRVYPVEGEPVVSFAAEGQATLALPLPAEAVTEGWQIIAITMTVKARLAMLRILPAIDAEPSATAELVLDADHAIAIQVEQTQVARFATLSGIRTLLAVEPGGAEVAAALLSDRSGPGEPLPTGGLLPATIDGPRGAPQAAWVTLTAPRPIPVPPDAAIWAVLQLARGRATFPLLASGGDEIRRGMPGGPWRAFSSAVPITPRGQVRLIGTAPEGAPIPALRVQLPATAQGATPASDDRSSWEGTPTSDGVGVTIQPASTVPVTAAGVMSDGALQLSLTASAPGAYRFSEVRVLYRLPTDQA